MARAAAGVEQGARGVQVAAHAEVEVGLALAAHGGGEVEHGIGVGQRQCAVGGLLVQVALHELDACVGREVGGRRHAVGERDACDVFGRAASQCERAAGEQGAGEAGAEEAAAAGDENVHGVCLSWVGGAQTLDAIFSILSQRAARCPGRS
ncbi:hypothetical protein D3C72_1294100 [compost metagenome]